MHLLKQLRAATGLTKYAMAKALGMEWPNYHRAEQRGLSLRFDHLNRVLDLAEKRGIAMSEVRGWIEQDCEEIERSKKGKAERQPEN